MDFTQLVSAGTVAALLWSARTLLEAVRLLAVHEEKHRTHEARLEKLEKHHDTHCPHS